MNTTNNKNIVIIGAGSAGIATAAELAKYGLQSTLVDEATKIGGVVYRGPLRKSSNLPHLDPNWQRSKSALHRRYESNSDLIHLQLQTTVIGPEGQHGIIVNHKEKLSHLSYDALVIASGCHERSIPFPGWMLPGVMLMGGVQLQIKSGLVRPGKKMALCGTGPLLPLVACQLHKAGVDVVGVYEASHFSRLAKEAVALMNKPRLTLSGLSMHAYMKTHHIPFHYGWGMVEAQGEQELESITVAPYDHEWNAQLNKTKTVALDGVGIGYGFVARTQISQLLQLDHQYSYQSGYVPVINEWQQTNREDIFVAGDTSGILGSDGAIYSGQIAALAIAKSFNAIDVSTADQKAEKVRQKLNRVKRFRFGFDRFSERQLGLLNLTQPETIVCRCENIQRSAIDEAFDQGVRDIASLKMRTRIGMGDCQGKTCSSYCYDRFKQAGLLEEMGQIRARFPLDPISFATMEDE